MSGQSGSSPRRPHGDGHNHHHHGYAGGAPAAGHSRPLAIVLGITVAVLIIETIGAAWTGSLALLADAGHLLTDVAGLCLALLAAVLSARPATDTRTWGYRRAEILAAATQAAILLAVGVAVIVEGIQRLIAPPELASGMMVAFGVLGLLGNVVSILLLTRLGSGNLNTRAALLEVVNDALGSVAVLIAATVIAITGWSRADAVASLLIGAMILPRTVTILRESIHVLMEATPRRLDLADVRSHILEVPHVHGVHDLHASMVATGLPVLTAHVVVDDSCFRDGCLPGLLIKLQRCLTGHFDIDHSTFQFEPASHAIHEVAFHA